MDKLSYRCHRFPSIVIQQAVWLYFRFGVPSVEASGGAQC
jgi:hypothetical protein